MSAEEFGQWQVMFRVDELHPAVEQLRHTQVLASMHNGPLSRIDRRLWGAADFRSPDPLAPAPRRPTRKQIGAQIHAMNAARRAVH